MRDSCFIAALMASCLATVGCGGGSKKHEPVYAVSGKITYKNEPIAGADVTFLCAEKNRSAFGKTNSQGKFTLTTFSPNDGAVAGKHVVVITKLIPAAPKKVADLSSREYQPPVNDESTDPTPPENAVPAKYASSATSDLIAVISADAPVAEMNLELTD